MTDEEKEAFYDADIAPVLLDLAKKCKDLDIPFLAVVEWNPGEIGRTVVQIPDQSMAMTMLNLSAAAGNNLDSFMINLIRHCKAKGIDTSSSMVMKLICEKAMAPT